MVYNAMYPVGQRPYFITNRKIKKKEDEESSNSSAAKKEVEEEQPQVLKHEGNDEFTKTISPEIAPESPQQNANMPASYSANAVSAPPKSYANINPEVNIAQILKDYKNTENAIGTPPELEKEVDSYLGLVQMEVQKENPNTKIVKANLKSAAILLDGYITETLQRPSKVVENWADALFLQKINYKYDEQEVNEQFLVKFPKRKESESNTTAINENEKSSQEINSSNTDAANTNSKISAQLPEDSQLANLFIKARGYSDSEDTEKALSTFKQVLARADDVKDSETKAKAYLEMGQIYDKHNFLPTALENYYQAATTASDANVKSKAYFSMAKIYDESSHLDPAVDNYMASVSYAGESENFKAQSTSLAKIGNILTDKYDDKAFEFYDEAYEMGGISGNSKIKGYVAANAADAYVQFKQPQNALHSYFIAVKDYSETDSSSKKIAQNYYKAADLMNEYGNPAKAKSLLLKARNNAVSANDSELIAQINKKLSQV